MSIYVKTRFGGAIYKRLLPFIDAVDALPDRHFTFTSDGFEPLSLEFPECTFNGCPVYGMMHYYTQNGDLMRDPDMSFFVDRESACIVPMSYEMSALGTYREVFDGEPEAVRRGLLSELSDFMNTWTKNILAQGFDPKQAEREAGRDDPEGPVVPGGPDLSVEITPEKFLETFCS